MPKLYIIATTENKKSVLNENKGKMKKLLLAILTLATTSLFAQEKTKVDWKDSDLVEFVWNTIGEKVDFRVAIIGSAITPEELESKEAFEMFEKLPAHADAVIVSSKEQQKAIGGKVNLKVFLAEKPFDVQYNQKGSFARWQIVANKGQEIIKMTATMTPLKLIQPRSERGKPQE